jgi:SAM-dependent methyltransferase
MWNDVVELREFYASPLGQVARQIIGQKLRDVWPSLRGLQLLGLGYAAPYLAGFRAEANRTIAAMPAGQGALPWPEGARGLTLLADETNLPLPDRSFERILLVHGLEFGEPPHELLREIWRVLADDGRLLVIAPARRGMWSRSDRTPFGQGQPYSMSQLTRLLRENMFTPTTTARALYLPPIASQTLLRWAPTWERLGRRWFARFAGALLIEAGKEIYAATPLRRLQRRRRVLLPTPPLPAHTRARSENEHPRQVSREGSLLRHPREGGNQSLHRA